MVQKQIRENKKGKVRLLLLPLAGLDLTAVVVSSYMGRLRLLSADNGAVEFLAIADDSSFVAVKSPKSMLSECSLLDVPIMSSSSLPTSDVEEAEDPADDRFILDVLLLAVTEDDDTRPPPVEGLGLLLIPLCAIGEVLELLVVVPSLLFSARNGSKPLNTSFKNRTEKTLRSPQILTVKNNKNETND